MVIYSHSVNIYRIRSYVELFLNGIITYDEWIALEVGMWKGLQLDTIKNS